jgi:putative ABC transport system substrate-binding protein
LDLGYVQGRNLALEVRWAEGQTDRLDALAADLVRHQVDVLVASSALAARAAAKATKTIPIVQMSGGDPVRSGVAGSLARPEGNVTGFTHQTEVLSGKLLDFLVMAVPGLTRVGVLLTPGAPVTEPQMRTLEAAAATLKLELRPVGLTEPNAAARAFDELARENVQGLVIFSSAVIADASRAIGELCIRSKLPSISPYAYQARHGGLMAYGLDLHDLYRQTAQSVDRILKGAKPGELPIELPTRLELVINLKAAKVLGLDVPPVLLTQADELIE